MAWEDVSMDEGTGIVHIAPGCGAEDFELGRREGLATLIPVDEAGAFTAEYGWLHGKHTGEVPQLHHRGHGPARLPGRGRRDHPSLPGLLALRHRAHLPAGGRVVHPLRRHPPADDRRRPRRRVDAAPVRQADGGLAAQHGRLVHLAQALLGAAAAVLLLPGRAHDRDRLQGGAPGAGASRHREPLRAAPAVDRRGGDRLRVREGGAPAAGRRRLLAGRGDRPLLDPRLAQPGVP